MKSRPGIVAIVGRANVGKSSLFNALIGKQTAITAREAGTTRDSLTEKAHHKDRDFWLVDTAGLKSAEDEFEMTIQEQIGQTADTADAIIVVVDSTSAIAAEDRQVATLALKTRKPVILAINKVDTGRKVDISAWQKLGIKTICPVSAIHKLGFEYLLDSISSHLPKKVIKEDPNRIKIAILGRPNVGKSSLFNAVGKKQQALVADRAGTTRDVNRLSVRFEGRELEFLDTAGIRRSGKIGRGVEHFSVLRAIAAIEEADVCLLLIDSQEVAVKLDQKIAGMIKDAGKGLIMVISKWDLADQSEHDHSGTARLIANTYDFVPWAPLVFTSSVIGLNISKIFELILQIDANRQIKISTPELNKWLSSATAHHPPAGLKNTRPKLNYMVQETDQPMPSFKIFGSQLKLLHWSYRRYLEKALRQQWPFEGTPVKFWFINKT